MIVGDMNAYDQQAATRMHGLIEENRQAATAPSDKIAGAAEWLGPGEIAHRYNPDPMLMGDCRVCGHTRDAHIAIAGQGETP